MKILLTDDEKVFSRVLQKVLQSKGYDVDIAYNGSEALKLIESTTYDVIVTDIIMPEKDGIELILDIRSMQPNAKIIAISGGGRIAANDHLDAAKRLGADCILTKPFPASELIKQINQLVIGIP